MSMMKGNTTINNLSRKRQAWFVATKLQIELIVEVDDAVLHLPKLKLLERVVCFCKFPLLSRSGRLNKLVFEFRDTENDHIKLAGFPGGAESFELAAKFCYVSIPLEITASNVASLRCAAEYLEMTEDVEEGNLISKTEAFLSYTLMASWLDCITVLQSCSRLSPWAKNLNIEHRCVESIAWKAATDPARVRWPFTRTEKTYDVRSPLYKHHCIIPNNKGICMQSSCGEGESSRGEVYESERPTQIPDIRQEIQKLRAEFTTLEKFCRSIVEQLEKFSAEKTGVLPALPLQLPWSSKYFISKSRNRKQKAGPFSSSILKEVPVPTEENHSTSSTQAGNRIMGNCIKQRRNSM